VALSQVTAIAQTMLRILPPVLPANIIKYDASAVPVLQLDYKAIPWPSRNCSISVRLHPHAVGYIQGPRFRFHMREVAMVMVDLNPSHVREATLPGDISSVLGNQNMILPAGTAKIGDRITR